MPIRGGWDQIALGVVENGFAARKSDSLHFFHLRVIIWVGDLQDSAEILNALFVESVRGAACDFIGARLQEQFQQNIRRNDGSPGSSRIQRRSLAKIAIALLSTGCKYSDIRVAESASEPISDNRHTARSDKDPAR